MFQFVIHMNVIFRIIFLIICGGALFAVSPAFVNAETAPKMYWVIFGVLLFCFGLILYSCWRGFVTRACNNLKDNNITQTRLTEPRQHVFELINAFYFAVVVSIFCLSVQGILQYFGVLPAINGFRVTGSFDNPAGFAACLCAGLPFVWRTRMTRITRILADNTIKKNLRLLAFFACKTITLILGALALCLSESRAGILSLCAVVLVILFWKIRKSKWGLRVKPAMTGFVVLCVLIAIIFGLYFLKKDSADGRLFIWQVSVEMIKDKPFTGFGLGGFKANYMNYQADFFTQNPDSKFVMIADNIKNPFNEYLLLVTNFGIAGLAVFLAFVGFVFYCYRKYFYRKVHKENAKSAKYSCTLRKLLRSLRLNFVSCSMLSLISIAVFSFFSYPFSYAFVWLIFAVNVFVIIYNSYFRHSAFDAESPRNRGLRVVARNDGFILKMTVLALIIPIVIGIGFFTFQQMKNEMLWCRIANKSLLGQTEKMMPHYEKLYKSLKNNYLFMYNYAAELNFAKKYDESQKIAFECKKLWADYDLTMIIADNYLNTNDFELAEQFYKQASAMCPVKFIPLQHLFKLYEQQGDSAKMQQTAKTILEKPVKVPSLIINEILKEMEGVVE